jgi:hypothetical protein
MYPMFLCFVALKLLFDLVAQRIDTLFLLSLFVLTQL